MKAIIFSFVTIFSISFLDAQTFGVVNSNNVGGSNANNAAISHLMGDISSSDAKRNSTPSDIQGSAYTTDKFLYGTVSYKDEVESKLYYRYNAYMEEIEIKKVNIPDAPIKSLNRDKNIVLRNPEGKTITFKTFIDKRKLTQNGYLTLINDGEYKLYKRVDVKFTEGQKAQNSFVKAIPPRFSKFTEYYLEVPGNNRIDELQMSNRKLIKLVPESKQELLKEYLKKNKIKIKNEADTISVLNWLDEQ